MHCCSRSDRISATCQLAGVCKSQGILISIGADTQAFFIVKLVPRPSPSRKDLSGVTLSGGSSAISSLSGTLWRATLNVFLPHNYCPDALNHPSVLYKVQAADTRLRARHYKDGNWTRACVPGSAAQLSSGAPLQRKLFDCNSIICVEMVVGLKPNTMTLDEKDTTIQFWTMRTTWRTS